MCDDDDDDDDDDDGGRREEEGGGKEERRRRGPPSLQNEDPAPQDGWEKMFGNVGSDCKKMAQHHL
eukprot:7362832-Pyramimonas_sp.AAC.1